VNREISSQYFPFVGLIRFHSLQISTAGYQQWEL